MATLSDRVALIGGSVSHSRSPAFHNYLFERFRLPYRFELMPLDDNAVVEQIDRMKLGGFLGANVTSPHKQRVIEAMDELSIEAERIASVNTIRFENGDAVGYNTDIYGFTSALDEAMTFSEPFTAAVIGTGGAALAAVDALLGCRELVELALYSRSRERAQAALDIFRDARVRAEQLDEFTRADLLVHATPVGLAGDPRQVLNSEELSGIGVLFEMIYSPRETPLVRSAHEVGARIVYGSRMFLHQALRSFELWTGIAVAAESIPEDLYTVRHTQ